VFVCVSWYKYLHVYICTYRLYVYICIYIYIHIYICTYIYIYMNIYIYIYICIYTCAQDIFIHIHNAYQCININFYTTICIHTPVHIPRPCKTHTRRTLSPLPSVPWLFADVHEQPHAHLSGPLPFLVAQCMCSPGLTTHTRPRAVVLPVPSVVFLLLGSSNGRMKSGRTITMKVDETHQAMR